MKWCKVQKHVFYPNVAKAGGEKRWPEIDPLLKFTFGLFLAKCFNAV
jgi:hypothetical protein